MGLHPPLEGEAGLVCVSQLLALQLLSCTKSDKLNALWRAQMCYADEAGSNICLLAIIYDVYIIQWTEI